MTHQSPNAQYGIDGEYIAPVVKVVCKTDCKQNQ